MLLPTPRRAQLAAGGRGQFLTPSQVDCCEFRDARVSGGSQLKLRQKLALSLVPSSTLVRL